MDQTKGRLSNTDGLAKNEWHKCSVYRVSVVSAFLLKEHVGLGNERRQNGFLELIQGWRLAGWKQWGTREGDLACVGRECWC